MKGIEERGQAREEPPAPTRLTAARRISGSLRRHPVLATVAIALAVGLVVFVLYWFQPQKLFLDQRVNEAVPTAAPPAAIDQTQEPGSTGTGTETRVVTPAAAEPITLASGQFRRLEHETTGRALVVELAGGGRILRFDDLETSNGPDLHVYLSEVPASDDWYAYGERFVSLGKLKGNIGDQNYEIPAELDLSKFKSAVIWCKRFSVGFGVAPLDLEGA
jgi:hypothetical protein